MTEYTLKEWVVEWLYTYKRILIKPSTFDSYLQYSTHIKCEKLLVDVRSSDVQMMVNEMVTDGLQLSTVKHALTVLRQSLRKARQLGMIDSMACMDEIELPKAAPKKIAPLTSEQINLLLDNAHQTFFGDFYIALLFTGCRVGELIALRWTDIDFFNNCIYICNTDYNGQLQSVKTANGVRCIPLYGKLYSILSERYKLPRGERVFLNTLGRPIVYRTLLDNWHWFCNSIGLYEPIGFHVLRHTFAHTALRNGVPIKVVSSWLGHADVSITLNIYDSVDSSDMKNAAHQLEAAFG